MKLTLSIEDSYTSVFLNFLKTLSYVKVEKETMIDILDEHKKLVRQRIKNTKPEELLDWDSVKNNLKLD